MVTPHHNDGKVADGYPQDASGWPTRADCQGAAGYADSLASAKLEVRKKRAEQEIEHAKALYEAQIALKTAEVEADRALWKTYYESVFEVAKGSMDRARSSAELVQKAAGAIVTLYTGALALAFSVSDNPLPWRGLIPAFFLGLAIVLSTGFLAYLPQEWPEEEVTEKDEASNQKEPRVEGLLGDALAAQFIRWSREAAIQRSSWLRGSVISLAVALFFLPAAFVEWGGAKVPSQPVAWPALGGECSNQR